MYLSRLGLKAAIIPFAGNMALTALSLKIHREFLPLVFSIKLECVDLLRACARYVCSFSLRQPNLLKAYNNICARENMRWIDGGRFMAPTTALKVHKRIDRELLEAGKLLFK